MKKYFLTAFFAILLIGAMSLALTATEKDKRSSCCSSVKAQTTQASVQTVSNAETAGCTGAVKTAETAGCTGAVKTAEVAEKSACTSTAVKTAAAGSCCGSKSSTATQTALVEGEQNPVEGQRTENR